MPPTRAARRARGDDERAQTVRGAAPGAPPADHPPDRPRRPPLAQIESIGSSVDEPVGALRTIDAELAATNGRLQRIYAELRAILENRTSASWPAGFAEAGRDLSETDQALLPICSKVFDDGAMGDVREMFIDSSASEVVIALK